MKSNSAYPELKQIVESNFIQLSKFTELHDVLKQQIGKANDQMMTISAIEDGVSFRLVCANRTITVRYSSVVEQNLYGRLDFIAGTETRLARLYFREDGMLPGCKYQEEPFHDGNDLEDEFELPQKISNLGMLNYIYAQFLKLLERDPDFVR